MLGAVHRAAPAARAAHAAGVTRSFARAMSQFAPSSTEFATCDPYKMSGHVPCTLYNLVDGEWTTTKDTIDIPDPLNGDPFVRMPNTSTDELQPFVDSLAKVKKVGLHNPLNNVERYVLYGEISYKAALALSSPEVEDYFARLIMRCMPKSYAQAVGEVRVVSQFLKNFSGDGVRFMAQDYGVSGDHDGQSSVAYRWPYGPVTIVAPFNFPLEIPALQLMGALYMGNKPVIKGASTVSVVLEQFIRLLHFCGMPMTDVDLLHSGGRVAGELIENPVVRMTQFTGSSGVAESLALATRGKIRVEDAGFDWKILGPDVHCFEYVAWQCDQDAYACSGQKCSAQSIMFAHKNWVDAGIYERMGELAARRKLSDLTIGPVLSETTAKMLGHAERLLSIPGARLLFGGRPLEDHTIPDVYGAIEPTAVFVPIDELLKEEHFEACVTEIFGPFQVVTEFGEGEEELAKVLEACERMSHHLTAAVVSNDLLFRSEVLANTVNGTTYAGIRARTTGAPANHWFGPAGDPRGAGIGSPEAIRLVWSCHREVIYDVWPVDDEWKTPPPS